MALRSTLDGAAPIDDTPGRRFFRRSCGGHPSAQVFSVPWRIAPDVRSGHAHTRNIVEGRRQRASPCPWKCPSQPHVSARCGNGTAVDAPASLAAIVFERAFGSQDLDRSGRPLGIKHTGPVEHRSRCHRSKRPRWNVDSRRIRQDLCRKTHHRTGPPMVGVSKADSTAYTEGG